MLRKENAVPTTLYFTTLRRRPLGSLAIWQCMVASPDQVGLIMRLWTIQTNAAFGELVRRGRLQTPKRLAYADFAGAYAWMCEQMSLRIGPPPSDRCSPIWAWKQYSRDAPMPELHCIGLLPRGAIRYRLEFEIDSSACLLSDFYEWMYTLNYWYLPESSEHQEEFLRQFNFYPHSFENPAPAHIDSRIRKSWELFFQLDRLSRDADGVTSDEMIQAVRRQLEVRFSDN